MHPPLDWVITTRTRDLEYAQNCSLSFSLRLEPKLKLFFSPGTCSLAVNIALQESGVAYTPIKVDLKTKKTAAGDDFNAINPKGYVPALVLDSGELLSEVPAVLQYVADQAPQANLAPANGTLARYQLQSWLTYIGTEIHKNFGPFFNPAATPEWKNACMANLGRRLAYANDQLQDKDYLMGSQFTIADAYLFNTLSWSKFIKLDLEQWPNLAAYQKRIAERPSVISARNLEKTA